MNDQVFTRATRGLEPEKRVKGCLLKGYKRVPVKNAPYPAAIPTFIQDEIVGDLVYLKSLEHVLVLDAFESEMYVISSL